MERIPNLLGKMTRCQFLGPPRESIFIINGSSPEPTNPRENGTLHVEMWILEKLIHMHICYAWNIGNRDQSSLALQKIEDIFNNLRVQGGNVHIVKENEMFGKIHYVPSKISIEGAKARCFLFAPIGKRTSGKWELWRYLCMETTFQTNNGSTMQEYKDVWIKLNEMVMIMRRSDLCSNDHNEF